MIERSRFCDSLIAQIFSALGEGAERFLFWGYNAECIRIIADLKRDGVPVASMVGIVDERSTVRGHDFNGLTVYGPHQLANLDFDTLVVTLDQKKELALTDFAKADGRRPRVILAGLGHLDFDDPDFEEIVQSCLVKSYATGYPHSLIHLYQAIRYVAAKRLKGDVAEFGICKGGTVVFIQKTLEKFGVKEAAVYGFDIFGGFPAKKSPLDLYRHPKCEFKDYETVVNYCERFGVKVIKGDICNTYIELKDKPLILSFFDTDNYSPTRAALEMCATQTVSGGILFFDHFTTESDYLYTIGERIAAKEVLDNEHFFNPHGTGLFIKM